MQNQCDKMKSLLEELGLEIETVKPVMTGILIKTKEDWGQAIASAYLKEAGFKIVSKGFRNGFYEVLVKA